MGLLLMNSVYADCNGELTIVDIQSSEVGDIVPVLSYTTIFEAGGVRSWDLWITDSEDSTVVLEKKRVDADTYTLAGSLLITDDFINGTYIVHSRIRVLNESDLDTVFCEETTSKEFHIESPRTNWNKQTINLELNPEHMLFTEYGLSFDLFVDAWSNTHNVSDSVSVTEDACFNISEKIKCENDLLDKDRLIERCNTQVAQGIGNLTEHLYNLTMKCEAEKANISRACQDKDVYIGDVVGRLGNLETGIRQTTQDLVNCSVQRTACERQMNDLPNFGMWVGLLGGSVFWIILILFGLHVIGSRKISQQKEG